ncbi:hypothetical protein [Veillonella parvula]|uniref:hypothetical protein n=1 Tax=Veillonella parvula TaxID=29466 RepID=UPI0028EAFD4D|nr:hypothetical protein [Veillonella parvula]
MNVRLEFRRSAESWVRRINSEELSVAEQKAAYDFAWNAFKWDCDSAAQSVVDALVNRGW